MNVILVIYFLSIQSSYIDNVEMLASVDNFDTIQFYSTGKDSWRIKTFAVDEDVHIHALGNSVTDIVALAQSNTEKNYGDVLSKYFVIESHEGIEGIRQELKKVGLSPNLEVSDKGFIFWVPENTNYKSKSRPES